MHIGLLELLESRFCAALAAAGCESVAAMVQPASRPEFGDYQVNGIMNAAKRLKIDPRSLAERVVANVELSLIASKIDIAGPGFVNVTLASNFLESTVSRALADERLAVPLRRGQRVVIDYSSPNLAKEMHVGHLRSTIIGDALARILRFLGDDVIAQNHVGDWGTQFGMLTAYLLESKQNELGELSDLEEFYRQAKRRFDEDAYFAQLAREYVVKLQSGEKQARELWAKFRDMSLRHCDVVYRKLGVGLRREDVYGESAYDEHLPELVQDLRAKGLAVDSDGAVVVYVAGFAGRDGAPRGYIVQKQDGAYLYSTTDLAAIRYRTQTLGATRLLYVVDARQTEHFQQLFAVARQAGYVPGGVTLEHVGFGVMLGKDGKPFKTRDGQTIKLIDLLEEARERAFKIVIEKGSDLGKDDSRRIADAIAIGAVKYADLSKNRVSDYAFDWDTMLSFEGNTAPYLQYAYARIQSIFRKAGFWNRGASISLAEQAERALALDLARFSDALHAAARESEPHLLCNYLFNLATQFMRFYEACPILKSEERVRDSRLRLCELTSRTMQTGLELLGIEAISVM